MEAQSTQPSLAQRRNFTSSSVLTAEQAGLYDRAALLMKKSLGMEDNPRRARQYVELPGIHVGGP